MIVSLRRGIAENKACIRTFSPLIEEIVLSGLMTLNTLRPARSIFDDYFFSPTSIPVSSSFWFDSVHNVR